ncbi:MAG: 50S ribosomal protein L4 [Flavobacteriales bacterium]|nr:50S ribosomal protein L4 [Flavobacteriales bacterium]
MELEIYNIEGKKTSKKVKLEDSVFGVEPNDHAIYLDVKQILANARQGTHKSKERGEITGSTKKIRKQKGTGGARRGDIKDPLLRGGGTIFGPRPRNYSFKLNKKLKKAARRSALSYKAKAEGITILDQLTMEAPKTKEFKTIVNNLGFDGKKTLFVVEEKSDNVYLSSRNIPGAKVTVASDLNTYDIMNSQQVVFTPGAIEVVHNNLKN